LTADCLRAGHGFPTTRVSYKELAEAAIEVAIDAVSGKTAAAIRKAAASGDVICGSNAATDRRA
jgi:hypothetical protein